MIITFKTKQKTATHWPWDNLSIFFSNRQNMSVFNRVWVILWCHSDLLASQSLFSHVFFHNYSVHYTRAYQRSHVITRVCLYLLIRLTCQATTSIPPLYGEGGGLSLPSYGARRGLPDCIIEKSAYLIL